jgi:phosphodiesterase/alkaline phosphatase D-like protein
MLFRILFLLLFSFHFSFAQTITHGPVAGGVTDTSARFVMFTNSTATVGIQVSTNAAFNPVLAQSSATTSASCANCAIVNISGLQPLTKYYYRPVVNGAFVTGDVRSFKTYPEKSTAAHFVITFGSCMNESRTDDAVFAEMSNHNPDLFLQIGDWGYPDFTDNLPSNPDYFPNDYNRLAGAFKNKYDYTHLKQFLKNVPIDYVWDDHDYVNNNASRTGSPITDFGIPVTVVEVPIPAQTRRNTIKGYYEMFPGYAPVDSSEGIFHKFIFGNVEVFMLDNRAARSPNTEALVNVGGNWTFAPPPGHSIIGDVQRTWLLDNLKKSTATWKLITTATAFNKTYGNTFSSLINLPNLAGLPLMASLIDCWSGFPMDQDTLINTVNQNGIDGVLMLSGDTHTSAIDDGQAGGLPEIMAGCLSQSNSTLYTTVPLLQFGLEWNKGGQGISTNNVNDAFGKLSVFGDDSLRMELIDENGTLIATHTMFSCSYQTGLKINAVSQNVTCNGVSDGKILITATGGTPPYSYSVDGDTYHSDSVIYNLAPGKYYPVVKDNNGCIKQTKVEIIEAPVFNVFPSTTDVKCNGENTGSAYFNLSGGQFPYQYDWSNGATTGGLFNLAAGNYDATVSDAFGCEKTFSIVLNEPDSLSASLVVASASCSNKYDGSIKILITGGVSPYALQWNNGSDSLTRNNLLPGNYAYTITDANNCNYTNVATVTSPPAIQVNATVVPDFSGNGDGAIYLNVTGGTAPYSYTWISGSVNDTLTNLSAGNYLVQVTDANGCRTSKSFVVTNATYVEDENLIGLNIFPNPAQHIIHIELQLPFTSDVNVKVFNVLGEVVMLKEFPLIKNTIISLETGALPSGNYFLLIEGDKFKKAGRIVVSK